MSSNSLYFGAAILIALLLVLFVILLRAYRFLFKHSVIFGENVQTRLIALAVTSIFFTSGINLLFIEPARILIRLIADLFDGISRAFQSIEENDFPIIFKGLLNGIYDAISFYGITTVMMALACWSFVGQFINSMRNEGKNITSSGSGVMTRSMRQNLTLGLLFLLSVYLSLASIIAVPYFLEDDKIQVSNDRMKSRLDTLRQSHWNDLTPIQSPQSYDVDTSFQRLIKSIKQPTLKIQAENNLRDIKLSYDQNIGTRSKGEQMLKEQMDKYHKEMERAYDEALNKYKEEENNLKSRLKLTYINQLAVWFDQRVRFSAEGAGQVKRIVSNGDDLLRLAQTNFNHDFKTLLSDMFAAPDTVDAEQFTIDHYYLRLKMANYYDDLNYMDPDNQFRYASTAPVAPVPGEELGLFKSISQWLLKPHSMALVLIVGMVGFGLFGSAISTFVKSVSNKSIAYSEMDIPGVVIRGVSAAIVIFLAVKGGMSVFSQADSELNPYSLFFTCMVGAVYSERIWEWAKDKLETSFDKSNSSGTGTQGASTNETGVQGEEEKKDDGAVG